MHKRLQWLLLSDTLSMCKSPTDNLIITAQGVKLKRSLTRLSDFSFIQRTDPVRMIHLLRSRNGVASLSASLLMHHLFQRLVFSFTVRYEHMASSLRVGDWHNSCLGRIKTKLCWKSSAQSSTRLQKWGTNPQNQNSPVLMWFATAALVPRSVHKSRIYSSVALV